MKKNSYWFRHDASAGRGIRLRKIQHIYGHWGKGIYWDVVELLRDQSGYQYPCDESALQLLCSLIGCNDFPKFMCWFNDCIKVDLLRKNKGIEDSNGSQKADFNEENKGIDSTQNQGGSYNFYCPALSENMHFIEKQRENGKKGGRPELEIQFENKGINPNETQTKANPNPNPNPEITITDRHTDRQTLSSSFSVFDNFRISYPGKKRGADTEFANFKKKHKDWQAVLPLLSPAVENQKAARAHKKSTGGFVPEWKHLPTWINQRCWEEEVELPPSKTDQKPEITHKQMFPQVD